MTTLLSKLNSYFNPKNDMKHIRDYVLGCPYDISTFYNAMNPIVRLASKPTLRGGLIGAVLGASVGYLLGYDVSDSAKDGLTLGQSLDSIQTLARLLLPYKEPA